ncbi:hypothetical protein K474DRAFT_1711192 [Panus rudis PR-1116 ss-1]|nr:hypothetical protein K474DRAFT_1711192 [Panus rudis PR-1116 ss-1]
MRFSLATVVSFLAAACSVAPTLAAPHPYGQAGLAARYEELDRRIEEVAGALLRRELLAARDDSSQLQRRKGFGPLGIIGDVVDVVGSVAGGGGDSGPKTIIQLPKPAPTLIS